MILRLNLQEKVLRNCNDVGVHGTLKLENRNWKFGLHAFNRSQLSVHSYAWVLPCVARGEAWVISPEILLSNFKFPRFSFVKDRIYATLRQVSSRERLRYFDFFFYPHYFIIYFGYVLHDFGKNFICPFFINLLTVYPFI